jgi:hypothetical protein
MLLLAALLAGCSDDPNRPPIGGGGIGPIGGGGGGGGGGTRGDGGATDGGDGGADGGVCTDLAPAGAVIDLLGVADEPPPGLGGAIGEGTYDVTDARLYVGAGALPGPTNTSYQGSIRVNAQVFERSIVFRTASNAVQERRVSGALLPGTATGNATLALTCPGNSQESVTYTASGNNLILVDPGTRVALTFTKRP